MLLFRPAILLLAYILPSSAFFFWFTGTPTQCSNMTVEWNGGRPPLTLLLVPTGHLNPETRTIIQRDIPSGNSISFVLDFPSQSQFIAVLNDASGTGAGGTSVVTSVASSSDSSCLSTTASSPKFLLFLPDDIDQCESVDVSWQPDAEDPVDVLALIPGGQSFEVANVSDGSTSIDWTADVRSGTNVLFVAGDKDGLGSGGSSDVVKIGNGDDGCIDNSSPSSTSGAAAGGVSTSSEGQIGSTGTAGGGSTSSGDIGATSNSNSDVSDEPTGTNSGETSPIMSSTGGSSGGTNSPSGTDTEGGSTGSSTSNGHSSSIGGSNFPGSGGGTVTGSPNKSDLSRHSDLGLILGLVLGLLALLGCSVGGFVLYWRRRSASAYRNLETGAASRPQPWICALTRGARSPGAHLRGGVGSSVDTLPSMYQTEPFILPPEQQPFIPDPPLPVQPQRPGLAARVSSSRSIQNVLSEMPYVSDALGGGLVGVHGPDRKDSVGPHGLPSSWMPSGRDARARGVPPSVVTDPPTRLTRDSEDFSPELEEVSPNPFEETFVEIPPTYTSVRRASSNEPRREAWHPTDTSGARLTRSNASRYSRRSTHSPVGSRGSSENYS
ncbi:hypothetical protein DFH11DRAFT_1510724 [Phellopilus nigrolimitatus]|nr:hypothetical protein DFH11DRAFT_1510724 [Phellopilus nigrolimitatus]